MFVRPKRCELREFQLVASNMDRNRVDDRSAIAVAWSWATRIMVVSAEMVAPGLLGYYFLDRRLGTNMLFLLVGLAVGMVLATLHLVRMTNSLSKTHKTQSRTHRLL